MTTALAQHWQPMLAAAAAGLMLGVAFVAISCLAPLIRLRPTADPAKRARVLREEVRRLRRLGDAAAVLEEHGRTPEAKGLRAEAEVRALLLLRATWARRRVLESGHGRT